jgi:hypothetical protein
LQHISNYQPAQLKLTPELFYKYVDHVVDSDYAETIKRYIYKTSSSNSWVTIVKEDLTTHGLHSLMIRHLMHQDFYLGVSCSDRTQHLIIDLDFRSDVSELNHRCNAVIDALKAAIGLPNVILRSSDKQGRHLRWLLGNPLDRQKLHNFTKGLLKDAGIELQKGVVEVFPGINHKAIRMPLGIGGAILSSSYDVLWDQSTPLAYGLTTYISLCQSRVNIIKVTNHPRWGSVVDKTRVETIGSESDPFRQAEEVWLPIGLTNHSQKLKAIVDLSIHNWHAGLTEVEAIASIQDWLKAKNNGFSKDYIDDPEKELSITIPSAVRFIYDSAEEQGFRKRHCSYNFEKQNLSKQDVKMILELTDDFDRQLWLFSLLTYIKTHQTNGQVVLHCLTMNDLRGCSMNSRTMLMEYAVSLGIIELIEEYSKDRAKARLFKFNWTFSTDTDTYSTIESFLLKNYKYSQLVKKYNRYRAMAIRNHTDSVDIISNYSMLNKQQDKAVVEDFAGKSLWDLWKSKS